ncbi:MAG: DUF1538 domain-containing protein [Syntrophobacteraceae bacterium]
MSELLEFFKFGEVLIEVVTALSPLVLFFAIFQVLFLKLPISYVANLLKGVALSFVGLVLFLQGVKVGFLPAGASMGEILGASNQKWILTGIGFILGFVATIAEPAVRILSFEVEKASNGAIKGKAIMVTLALGVAVFVSIGMARIIYGIPIHYLLVPGYLTALVMLKFTDSTFISIAFDAGGVATGPMTVTFVMAMAVGIAGAMENRSPILDGFGLIALVALAPILSVMSFGLVYSARKRR